MLNTGHTAPPLSFLRMIRHTLLLLALSPFFSFRLAAEDGLLARFAHKLTEPKVYACRPTHGLITIDGRLNESDWQRADRTDLFVDIQGEGHPRPKYATTARLLWDADHLYIAATLEEPNVTARLRQRDTIIWKENDFEVFLDPEGRGIDYYEWEVNARNTMMDLLLTHPYRAGGEFLLSWDCTGLRHAVQVDGTLNDSRDTDRGWTVEMAIPIRSLRKNFRNTEGAKAGEVWRINFSRVEWLHPEGPEENWVWSPCGEIAMHMPERWGYLCFLNEGEAPTLPAHHAERRLLWALYYAQEAHRARTGAFAASLAELGCTAADRATLTPDARLSLEATISRFVLRATLSDGRTLSLDERGQWDEQVP